MNRDQTGANGQFVTTWGSDTRPDGKIIPGSERPVITRLSCRCAVSAEYRGFPDKTQNLKLGFVNPAGREWFCSLRCAAKFDPTGLSSTIEALRSQAAESLDYANSMIAALLVSPTSPVDPA
jgi:hypothetical protein